MVRLAPLILASFFNLLGSVLKHLKRASDWFAEDFDDETAEGTASGPPEATNKYAVRMMSQLHVAITFSACLLAV